MTPKILINIQDGKLVSALANGEIELLVHNLDSLAGIQAVPVTQRTCADFELLTVEPCTQDYARTT